MKKQYFINANIIDPHNSINENGGMIIAEDGSIEAIGKKVNTNNIPSREKIIDLKGKYIFPGLVDMRVFAGEPGYEYKENFRTLSNAALAGGVTSVVTMPNTDPIIDNVSIVDFLKRRGRDKSKINVFPSAALTKNIEGITMTEFGLLQSRGIIGFTDGIKTIQNTRLMSRIMNSAKDLGTLIMQHAEDYELSKNGMINSGIIATKLGLSGISSVAERIIIERDLTLLENIKCRYHISLVSAAKSIEIIKEIKPKFIFLEKRIKNDIWKNMYQFPLFEESIESFSPPKDLIKTSILSKKTEVTHLLTHQKLNVTFWEFEIKKLFQNKKYERIEIKKLNEYAVPKIVENYINQNITIHRL